MQSPSSIENTQEQSYFFPELAKKNRSDKTGMVKNFVLDTNVLLHDPHCLNRFQNNHVYIPIEVLTELDNFKNEQTERGAMPAERIGFLVKFSVIIQRVSRVERQPLAAAR